MNFFFKVHKVFLVYQAIVVLKVLEDDRVLMVFLVKKVIVVNMAAKENE
jgi:hypothetical protein